ncbi:MAG: Rab family GTPase [Candidatus Hodarchaeales archaeon]|jgi:signal recognition particle receptor subunit beta
MFRQPDTRDVTRRSPKFGETIHNLGKIGCVGTGGAGKTKTIISICNTAAHKRIYTWDEKAELLGTTSVHPYSLQFQKEEKNVTQVELVDNPGQNSLEHLRVTVAQSGEKYKGLIIFLDAIGWNFWLIGLQQANTLMDALGVKKLPLTLIISKWDLQQELLGKKALIDDITREIVKLVADIKPGVKLPYYDRINNIVKYLPFESDKGTIPFTQLEQILVNGLDKYLQTKPIQGFTPLNVRLLIRSLLFGYCNLFKNYLYLPEFAKKHPELIIEDNIIYALNYYRPTAYETQISWQKMAGDEKAKEAPMLLESFTFPNIANIFKKEVVCPSTDDIDDYVNELVRDEYEIVSYIASNSQNRESIEKILPIIEKLTSHESFLTSQDKDKTPSSDKNSQKFTKHKLPPKPRPKKWNE